MKSLLRWGVLAICMLAAGQSKAGEITVFAAASLTDSLKEIAASYEKTSGDKVIFNFGASSALAQQIMAGSPADVFFSADEAKMNALAAKDLIVKDTRVSVLGNTLVVVTATDAPAMTKLEDLTQPTIKYISLGDPRAVPVGVYAKAYLEKAGLWEKLEPKIAPAENVRASLAVVESGNAEAGIVYKTDATISKKVRIAFELPAAEGPRISYPMALVKDSRQPLAAKKFMLYLTGTDATAIFQRFGFSILR